MQQLGAKILFPGTATIGAPRAAEIADLARIRKFRQLGQRSREDDLAALSVVRRTEGPADGVIDEGAARRRDPAHDVVSRADDQSRDASAFDHVGDETDGLMAKRSVGHEEREIDLRLCQLIGERRSEIVLDFLMPAHTAHERKMTGRDAADNAVRRQFREGRARKDDLGIFPGNAADAGMMIDNNGAGTGIGRHAAVTQIFARNERRLIAQTQRRAGKERYA